MAVHPHAAGPEAHSLAPQAAPLLDARGAVQGDPPPGGHDPVPRETLTVLEGEDRQSRGMRIAQRGRDLAVGHYTARRDPGDKTTEPS